MMLWLMPNCDTYLLEPDSIVYLAGAKIKIAETLEVTHILRAARTHPTKQILEMHQHSAYLPQPGTSAVISSGLKRNDTK